MTKPANTSVAVLAACLSLTALVGACNRDEPATYLPESGNWSYVETTVVSNSCDANLVPAAPTMFLLDYDDGDTFVDYPDDPQCRNAKDDNELSNPTKQCANGVDDDGDTLADYPADPQCRDADDDNELSDTGCGLGAELALLLVAAARARRRRGCSS